MDLHEKHQLDLAAHMAKVNEQVTLVKRRARPWRSIIAFILAVAAGTVASQAGLHFKDWTGHGNYTPKIIAAGNIVAFCVFMMVAVVGIAGKTRDLLTPAIGSSHAAIVRYAILLIGGAVTVVFALDLLKVPVGLLVASGAATTIVLGIAGQQSLSNIFAGIVLLISRPFVVGDYVRVKSGALGGITDGQITEVGITYLRIDTAEGTLHLPNSQVLAAAVGPIPPPPDTAAGQPAPPASVHQPAAGGPPAADPPVALAEPAVSEPGGAQREGARPATAQPATAQPQAAQPQAAQPAADDPRHGTP